MIFDKLNTDTATVSYAAFEGELSLEYNLIISPLIKGSVDIQLNAVNKALAHFLQTHQLTSENIIFRRFFVSDLSNQPEVFPEEDSPLENSALSVIQQSPLNGSKIALWISLLVGRKETHFIKIKGSNSLRIIHNGYSHIYSTQLHSKLSSPDSYLQTTFIFSEYLDQLRNQNLSLNNHCMRTWFYIRDIDNNYSGMVKARNDIFEKNQLTTDTHFISSTGIEGRYKNPETVVLLDAYAIGGIKQEQITYLQAREYLNPTHEYGVAFERGTAVEYGDRRHIFISGTASIDHHGQIVAPCNLNGQICRTFKNIQALLKEADAGMHDLNSMIIYLRDITDYPQVEAYIQENYPQIPYIIVHAPVCRPGWLIEIECIGIKSVKNETYNCF